MNGRTHRRHRQVNPHDHLVLLCQECHGDLWPHFKDANGKTIWRCHSCRGWWTYTRWGWASVDGAAALRSQTHGA